MKTIFTLLFILFSTSLLLAQEIRVNLYSAYVFDDRFTSYYDSYNYYDGKVNGGYQWGAGFEYFLNDVHSIELSYFNQNTTAPTTYQVGLNEPVYNTDLDLKLNYLMFGGMRYLERADGKIDGYAGILLGAVFGNISNPKTDHSASATKFGWGARLGADFWLSDKVAIKVQAQLLSVVQGAGGTFYFGTDGSGVGVSAYSTFYQLGLGGGLVYRVR